ncbi:MAG: LysM peptidoglycan-binding domain-containing protein [Acidobacteriota bacterium]|nr:LysM peptidoglycan-binding domain-containing protein [Acidobacteriota bacterium]
MIRDKLVALLASLAMAAIVVGMPVVLVAVGQTTLPTTWPSLQQVWRMLVTPDDGTLALGAIVVAGWVVWAVLTVSLLIEIVAAVRGIKAPSVPVLPQSVARRLVAAAAMLAVSAPPALYGASSALADEPPASPVATAPPTISPAQTPTTPHGTDEDGLIDHVVQPGETLSGIADAYLGDPGRWPEIFDASADVEQPYGGRLTNPDLIVEDWTLRIPAHATALEPGTVLVRPGDNLSQIAADHLGDPERWPEIYEATRAIVQPDGRQLSDPDLIEPGWKLVLPNTANSPVTPAPVPQLDDTSHALTAPVAPTPQDTPSPTDPPPAGPTEQSTGQPADDEDADDPAPEVSVVNPVAGMSAPWLLTGFTMGGAVLAGSALMLLRSRREQQFRLRRPGRSIPTPEARVAPVEKTIRVVGSVAEPSVSFMDVALRRLAGHQTQTGAPMPRVAAVELRGEALTLHLSEPASLDAPWTALDDSQMRWALASDIDLHQIGPMNRHQPAPYPLLVTCGTSDAGDIWLLNLEELGTIQVTGDPVNADDFMRYIAAEVAVNPWSRDARVTCLGVAEEAFGMNPERCRTPDDPAQTTKELLRGAEDAAAFAARVDADAATARATKPSDDLWWAQAVLVDSAAVSGSEGLRRLIEMVQDQPVTTGTAIIVAGHDDALTGPELVFTPQGRVLVGVIGLDLVAVGLTPDEARGCASLLGQAERGDDFPMPATGGDTNGWRGLIDDAGALRDEFTIPRTMDTVMPTHSVIEDDGTPLPETTTPQDLAELAPKITDGVREAVEKADPNLDADVADWFAESCWRPRLTLLGPVGVRAHGVALANRKPFFTELLAFIALKEHGATPEEVAIAFGHKPSTSRNSVKVLRDWLGVNPRTGRDHLPDATKSRAAKTRGAAVYEVDDLLVDVDLFRRLRARGEARGSEGISDLVTALELVMGRPFDQLRGTGWAWLADMNIDHHMVCAIVDVAHLVTTHFLKTDDLRKARATVEKALVAAPYDTIPKLDLAAIAHAEGHTEEAKRIVHEEVCNVLDDGGLPEDVSERTAEIIASFEWFGRRAVS